MSALRRNPQPNGSYIWLERIKQIVIRSGVQEQSQIGGCARLRGHKQQRPMRDLPLSQALAQLNGSPRGVNFHWFGAADEILERLAGLHDDAGPEAIRSEFA